MTLCKMSCAVLVQMNGMVRISANVTADFRMVTDRTSVLMISGIYVFARAGVNEPH